MHLSFASRLSLLVATGVGLPTLFACLDHPLKPVEYEAAQEKQDSIALTVNKDVDILFVIDNSGSMGEEQGTLASNFASFINVLEEETVKANYRIGVTTSDNSNPWCPGTTPEAGQLRLSSCRARQTEFVFSGSQMVDATQEACLDVCKYDNIEITETTTDLDDAPAPRLWLESIEGRTNLGAGTCAAGEDCGDAPTTVEAFQCFGPQGINGCGFEQQLESMYKAIKRAENADEAIYGFIRPNAILSVVHVTDEADCS
ncbi:MAG: VWA domain-containing protein, partial [Myxococcota bacterium]